MIPHEDEIRALAIAEENARMGLEYFLDSTNQPALFGDAARLKWASDKAVAYTKWMIAHSKLTQLQEYVSKPPPLVVP